MNNPGRGEMYKKYRENIKEQIANEEKTPKEKILKKLAERAGIKQKEEEEESR